MNNQISSKARIGKNVTIGPFTTIHDGVEIGDNSVIGSNCVLGIPTKLAKLETLVIAEDSFIRSHSVFYIGSEFGPHLVTGHSVIVRENIQGGRNLQIGGATELDPNTAFGNFVKIHSRVNIAGQTVIGDFVWIYPAVVLTNDPLPPSDVVEGITIKDMAIIASNSFLMPGVTVGTGSIVGAKSVVKHDVPDVHCVSGDPAKVVCRIDRLVNLEHGLSYPWPTHFRTGYPEESFPLMESIADKLERLIKEDKEKGEI